MNKRGFTLLEVSLFLAISGGLTLVALIGLGPRLTNVRFSSGMRGLQENVAKQISASELGNNTGTQKYNCEIDGANLKVTPGTSASSTCVFVGRLAVFKSTGVDYRSIIALRSAAECADPYSLEYITDCSFASVLSDVNASSQYVNGISLDSDLAGYGFVKSPDNNSVHRFIIESPIEDNKFQLKGAVSSLSTKDVCYKLSNRTAKLTLTTTRQEPTLEINGVCS